MNTIGIVVVRGFRRQSRWRAGRDDPAGEPNRLSALVIETRGTEAADGDYGNR